MYNVLNKINGPEDVKKLSLEELNELAEDIREGLFHRLTKIGGHFGPNFGIVETEIAMHYVFDSPKDKFVFDVSHQSYPHKMLTGRKLGYIDDAHFKEDSGYTNPEESEHDLFNVGHTSTSISLATGLAKARDLLGKKENVIALIGDGSLSGGEALEGLNVAGSELNSNLIIVVNDNQQSISETHGGIYKNLKELRDAKGNADNNMFNAMGLDYIYEENGNDIEAMIRVFEKVKDIDHPNTVVMVGTSSEEVGIRGARTAAYKVNPDVVFPLDVACFNNEFVRDHSNKRQIGKGMMQTNFDRTLAPNRRMIQLVRESAKRLGKPLQLDMFNGGGTDGGEVHKIREGKPTAVSCLPVRYGHCAYSIANYQDIEDAIEIFVDIIKHFDNETYKSTINFLGGN